MLLRVAEKHADALSLMFGAMVCRRQAMKGVRPIIAAWLSQTAAPAHGHASVDHATRLADSSPNRRSVDPTYGSLATLGDHAMTNALSLRIKAWCLTGTCFGLLAALGVVAGGCGASKERISSHNWNGTYQPLISRVGDLLRRPRDLRTSRERWYFIRDLGTTHDPAAYSVLAAILQDDGFSCHEKDVAATALAATGDPRALDVLKKAVEAGRITQGLGVAAFGVLAVNGENAEALNHVLRATQGDQDVEVRLVAVSALRPVNPNHAGAAAALERMVRSDPSMRVRVWAACALVAHGDKSYWKFVNGAARDQDAQVRLEVAENVPFQAEAIPVLLHLLGDEHMGVAFAAWEPLEKNLEVTDGVQPHSQPPYDLESQRELYRKAWEESQRK